MEMKDALTAVRRGWWIIVLSAVLGTLLIGGMAAREQPTYRSQSALYFALTGGTSATDLNQGVVYVQNQMPSFEDLAGMPIVLDPVAKKHGMTTRELKKLVTAKANASTVILNVDATTTSPTKSAQIANETAAQIVRVVGQVADKRADGVASARATVVRRAIPATSQFEPNKKKSAILGLTAGLIVGLVIALLRQLLDTRVRNREVVETHFPRTAVLGTVSRSGPRRVRLPGPPPKQRGRHMVHLTEDAQPAEEIRVLRTNLDFVGRDDSPCLVVTSAQAAEGKTTICASLGQALSEAGKRVLIIDADMRNPGIARYFGLVDEPGLSDALIGRASSTAAVQTVSDRLHVLVAGSIPPNPSELAASSAMDELLADLHQRYDVILIDTPPVLPVTDAALVARRSNGALVVVDGSRQRRSHLDETLKQLESAGVNVLGVVLNQVTDRRGHTYGYPTRT